MIPQLTRRSLLNAVEGLASADANLAASVQRYGPPPLWAREPAFATLVHLILEQQVSLASARAAFERLQAALDGVIEPPRFLALSESDLRGIGFSRQKGGYARELAVAFIDGFDLDQPQATTRRRGPREPHAIPRRRPLDRRHLLDHVPPTGRCVASWRPGPCRRRVRAVRAFKPAHVRRAGASSRGMAAAPSDGSEDPLAPLPVRPRALLSTYGLDPDGAWGSSTNRHRISHQRVNLRPAGCFG